MNTRFYFALLLFAGLWCSTGALRAQESGFHVVGGIGAHGEGAGMALTSLNNNDRPEILVMAYDGLEGPNQFRYKVGTDIDATGKPAVWSDPVTVGGVGNAGEGAGMAVASLDANARPDLLLMAYNAQPNANEFRYRVGANLNPQGVAAKWGPVFCIPGVGDHAEGAGMAVGDLDQNGQPDLVLMAYDAADGLNSFRYRVGRDIDADGRTRNWSGMLIVDGVGQPADGAGVAIGDFNDNGLPDMLLTAYLSSTPAPVFRYKIGYDLDANGFAARWTDILELPGTGDQAEGADVTVYDTNNDSVLEAIFMAYRASAVRFKTADLLPIK